VAAGQRIVTEGTTPEALFVIGSGAVQITRRAEAQSKHHAIRSLGPGETFGELGLLEDLPTSASVSAAAPTTLLVVPLAQLRGTVARDARFEPLFRGLAQQLNTRLRSLTDVTVQALEREVVELRARVAIGTLLVGVVAVLSLFTYSLSLSVQLVEAGLRQPVTLAISLLGVGTMGAVMNRSKLPLSFWGLSTDGWQRAVREALLYSLGFLGVLLAGKWVLIHSIEAWRHVPLFHLAALLEAGNTEAMRAHLGPLVVYILVVAPLQELVTRGCIQGVLQEFLTGPYRALWAIVTSNLIFSVLHSFISPQFAFLTLLPGLLWGWLYYRERTLIGPILSHILVGAVAFEVIGVLDIFPTLPVPH
jgi:membrane protease YdiL (CAAX protease family)